ncbi:MAG: galactose mutarotase [Oscillospiraceae bacterium]|nr:galactose mutarotase [Oscillospiraceae bacterium]
MTKKSFGTLPNGEQASLYTISCGSITATVTDYGAHLVSLWVPDKAGNLADVVLGYDDANGYRTGSCFIGATVGRSANRIAGSRFTLGGNTFTLTPNENSHNLHSGPDYYHLRMWDVEFYCENTITLRLDSPDGDQGFPGHAVIRVTYELDPMGGLHISYDAQADQDTVFNLTNHSYFNLAGHDKVDAAMEQLLTIPGQTFCPDDAENIPTGEERNVEGTPFDFRKPKAIGRDIEADYEPLKLQGGYDHNFQVYSNPCATLTAPDGSRSMMVYTDLPGIQFYAGNFIVDELGKGGVHYTKRSGICLETQYYPNSINNPAWDQPITPKGELYHSETVYWFY